MSATYREKLTRVTPTEKSYFRGKTTPCDKYDLSSLEKQLMRTEVYRNANGTDMLKRLSTADQFFDGSYCDRAKKATIRLKLVLNDYRYLEI